MKINWKVRLQSKTFLAACFAQLLVIVYTVAQLIGVTIPVSMEELLNVAATILQFLALLGVVTDPTTPGIDDSSRALSYDVPGGE